MALSGLTKNRKFLRLCAAIGDDARAFGSLSLIWDSCHEAADDHLGEAEDVEAMARWRGEPGALCAALLNAGGPGRAGFIEPDPERGGYRVHDYFVHAPDYVKRRVERALARQERGETISAIRSAAGRLGAQAKRDNAKPAEGEPKPAAKPPKVRSLSNVKRDEDREVFNRIWKLWPAKRSDGKPAKGKLPAAESAFQACLERGSTAEEIEKAAELYLTKYPKVQEGYVQYVSTFLNPKEGLWLWAVRALRGEL